MMAVILSKLRLSAAAAVLFGLSCISFAQAAVTTHVYQSGCRR